MEKNIKKRYQRIKFSSDEQFIKAQLVIYSNGVNDFGIKMINENNEEMKTTMTEIEGYYERTNNKDKIIFTQPIKDKCISNINLELTKYDAILVVDTSYELIKNVKMAFTCILLCPKISNCKDTFNYKQITNILEWDATSIEMPENFMYVHAIENIRLHNINKNQNPDMAVIVDSDLQNISFFNDRTKPIYEDYYLPENFSFFYASSDTGSENLQNKLIKICDKEAKIALQEYKNSLK